MLGLGRDNFHSSLVAWLKLLLPLAALAVLSTLFIVSRPINPEDAIPYAQVNIEDRLREPRLTEPSFSGMTADGSALTLKAAEARPGVPGQAAEGQATSLSGRLETPDGVVTTVDAALGRLDRTNRVITLSGGVTFDNSGGYHLTTDSLTMALDRTRLESGGSISATTPIGQVQADRMVLTRDADGRYKLDFTGGVRLLYQP